MIDLIIALLLILLAFLGYLKGGLNQLFSLAAIFLSILFAPSLGKILYVIISNRYELKVVYLSPIFTFISGVAIYIAVKIAGIFLERLIIGDRVILVKSNRILGLGLGSLKAVIIIIVSIFAIGYISRFHSSFSKYFDGAKQKSFFIKLIDRINPAGFLEIIPDLIKLKERIKYLPPKSNIYKDIMKDKRIRELMDEDKLEKLIEEKGLYSLIKDNSLKELHRDKSVQNILDKLNSGNDKSDKKKKK